MTILTTIILNPPTLDPTNWLECVWTEVKTRVEYTLPETPEEVDDEGTVIVAYAPEQYFPPEVISEAPIKCVSYHPTQMDLLEADASSLGTSLEPYSDLLEQWVSAYIPPTPIPLEARQAKVWHEIKALRDKRKAAGVKVGDHWFHSDTSSRIQQLGLVMMGSSIPPNTQWKTLTVPETNVFVTMTPTLAAQIFQQTSISDILIFNAAEQHKSRMEILENPEEYDYSGDWPESFVDAT